MCARRLDARLKVLLHCEHVCVFSGLDCGDSGLVTFDKDVSSGIKADFSFVSVTGL